jgi:hypothetical protein
VAGLATRTPRQRWRFGGEHSRCSRVSYVQVRSPVDAHDAWRSICEIESGVALRKRSMTRGGLGSTPLTKASLRRFGACCWLCPRNRNGDSRQC